jgi:DNA topoisomerase I
LKSPGNIYDKDVVAITGLNRVTRSGAKVPPAWTDVWVATDSRSDVEATGRDSKGRRVYLYSVEHMGRSAAAKFSRLKAFARVYPTLIKRLKRDLRSSEAALVLYLIAKTGFRVGSNKVTLSATKAFGASTLLCFHVSVAGDKISFDFTGKKGKQLSKVLKDKFLAKEISGRCAVEANRKIFRITDKKIRAYLSSIPECSEFIVKDFRTYRGTVTAYNKIKTLPFPRNRKEFIKYRKEVAKAVARELGNSSTVALKSYISPEVFCIWESSLAISLKEAWGKPSSSTDKFLECVYYDEDFVKEDYSRLEAT